MVITPDLSTEDRIKFRVASALQPDGTWSYFRYNKKGDCVRQIDGLSCEQQIQLRQGKIKEGSFK